MKQEMLYLSKVPVRPTPFHFKECVHTQLHEEMADASIIQPSDSLYY